MTKINNPNVYIYDTEVSGDDFLPGSDAKTPAKITKSYRINDIKNFVLAGLTPETGGILKISEIVIEDEELTTPADAINIMTPVYDVLRYHILFVNLNGQQFLLKQQDVTIGDGQNLVENSDFIEFPISVGPTGEDGKEIELQATLSHIQWRYVGDVSWINLISLSEITGPQGEDGVSVVGSGTTTSVSGVGSEGSPYIVEFVNLQKTITHPADFTSNNYNLINADNFNTILINNGSENVTITISEGLVSKIGVCFIQLGTGNVTFVEDGTTINSPSSMKKIKGQNFWAYIEQRTSTNIFQLLGSLKT